MCFCPLGHQPDDEEGKDGDDENEEDGGDEAVPLLPHESIVPDDGRPDYPELVTQDGRLSGAQ